jgi:hypothetical protein
LFASEKTESGQKSFFSRNKTHFAGKCKEKRSLVLFDVFRLLCIVGNCKEKRPLVLFDVFRHLCIEHWQRVQLGFGLINPLLPQVNLGA